MQRRRSSAFKKLQIAKRRDAAEYISYVEPCIAHYSAEVRIELGE
jgi:hypothetical protein